MSLSDASRKAIACNQLFEELDIILSAPPPILSDNQGALAITEKPVQHHQVKHSNPYYIRDAQKQISIGFIPTADQAADILTKPLHAPAHHHHLLLLGLSN